jgi:hypothetical protein
MHVGGLLSSLQWPNKQPGHLHPDVPDRILSFYQCRKYEPNFKIHQLQRQMSSPNSFCKRSSLLCTVIPNRLWCCGQLSSDRAQHAFSAPFRATTYSKHSRPEMQLQQQICSANEL